MGIVLLAWAGAAPAQADPPRAAQAQPPAPRVTQTLQMLADWVKGRGGSLSALIVDLDTGAVWAESAPSLALNPASNMKVLTAAVALKRLGPEFRFSTGLYGRIEKQRVDPLVLRGHGDPALSTPHLWQLAQTLQRLGVASVGTILVDQSRFDDQFVPPAFEQQPDEWARFRAPVSAVAIDQNAVTLHVLPTTAGQPARIWFEPSGIVSLDGAIETRRAGSGEAIQLSLESRNAELVAHVGGHVAEGLPRLRFERRLDDPRRAPGLALAELLRAVGITVSGSVGLGGSPVQERLVFHQSEPLAELVRELGKNSDNFYAEMLLKALGAEAGSVPARSQDGARVISEWLTQQGALTPDTRIENGSGLFDANRVSAATLVSVLRAAQKDPGVYPDFLAHLSIGGVDGTLRSRFRNLKAPRTIHAKTGTLAAAIGLSGYVLSPEGGAPIAFAFLANGIEGHAAAARQRIDRVVEAIVEARAARASAPKGHTISP
jgi:D-alanyl-D-alanine carboxypeptidase/D-alanyl-D-alanine-endopeptidase (penicillin-binding protein 4)